LNHILAAIQMTSGKGNPLRESIRTALAQPAGLPGADATVEATAVTWRLVAAQLAPIIGARGFEVLLGRALHIAGTTFPWLVAGANRDGATSPLPSLEGCLARQDPAAAAEASYTLLLTFTELLTTLIGESLTTRLLAPVWASPSLSSAQESAL
jgi:hypothetical protein